MLVHRRVTPSSKFAGTHLYTWVEGGTMRVKCLAQEHNAVPQPGLEPGPFDLESSALTIRPPHLPQTLSHKRQIDPSRKSKTVFLSETLSMHVLHYPLGCCSDKVAEKRAGFRLKSCFAGDLSSPKIFLCLIKYSSESIDLFARKPKKSIS